MHNNPVIFLHIPKTAGTTLNYIIYNNYTSANLLKFYISDYKYYTDFNEKFIIENAPLNIQNFKLDSIICGHMKFGIHSWLNLQNTQYITLMRDPYKHYISMFNHMVTDTRLRDFDRKHERNFEEFLKLKITYNMQTFLISGISNHDEIYSDPQKILQLAKDNIVNNFLLVGFTEKFEETIVLLKQKLNWKQTFYIWKNRRFSEEQIINSNLKSKIHSNIELDIQLYEFALEIFNKKINEIPFFTFKVNVQKIKNFIHFKRMKFLNKIASLRVSTFSTIKGKNTNDVRSY